MCNVYRSSRIYAWSWSSVTRGWSYFDYSPIISRRSTDYEIPVITNDSWFIFKTFWFAPPNCFPANQITDTDFKKEDSMRIKWLKVWFIVFNTAFNNISVISWLSVLLVEETGVPGENHRPAVSHWQTLSQNVVSTPTAPIKITILLRTWNTTKWNTIFRHNFCCLWTLYLVITCTFIFN